MGGSLIATCPGAAFKPTKIPWPSRSAEWCEGCRERCPSGGATRSSRRHLRRRSHPARAGNYLKSTSRLRRGSSTPVHPSVFNAKSPVFAPFLLTDVTVSAPAKEPLLLFVTVMGCALLAEPASCGGNAKLVGKEIAA